jgi:hypothetical protein
MSNDQKVRDLQNIAEFMVKSGYTLEDLRPYYNETPLPEFAVKENTDEGISEENLLAMQSHLVEGDSPLGIRPSELEGVSNVASLSNEQLTSELYELKRRFNNMNAGIHDGKF